METKNTNLNQQSDSSKKLQKNQNEPVKQNENSRIFNAGELSEKNQNRVTGQAGADTSTIPTEPQKEEWNKNEVAREDERMYAAKAGNKNQAGSKDLRDDEDQKDDNKEVK